MSNTFFISDTHWGHKNAACKFTKPDGTPLRPFSSLEEQNQTMIDNWNSVVGKKDRVYHLGDFCMPRKSLETLTELNGRICIILGNHDPWKKEDWFKYDNVTHVLGVKMMPKLGWVLTHVPVHQRQFELSSRWTHNIHGHLHDKIVTDSSGNADRRYFNVSVEQIDYTPIELEDLKKRL